MSDFLEVDIELTRTREYVSSKEISSKFKSHNLHTGCPRKHDSR